MPNSTDAILIILGAVLFIFSFLNGKLKIKDSDIPELSTASRKIIGVLGLILLVIGISSHFYTLTKKTDISPLPTSNNNSEKIRLTENNVRYLFKSKGFDEINEFPVTNEIISAINDGYRSYQSRVCKSNNRTHVLVPITFKRCPHGNTDEQPHLGPLLDLTVFKTKI